MTYITRNANLLLLFLIVLVVASFVGATIFFQVRFTKVNTEYDTKLDELKNLTEQADNYKAVLQKAQLELELKESREETISEKYTDAKTTAEQLQKTTAELQADIDGLTAQIIEKTKQISDLTLQVANLKSDIEDKDETIEDLDDKVDCLESTSDVSEGDC